MIEEIHPNAQYQGTVYTQTVVVKFNDTTMELFDGTATVATEEHIGESVALQITAQPVALDRSPRAQAGITPRDDGYNITGIVRKVDTAARDPQSSFCLDTGIGTVIVAVNSVVAERLEEIEPGTTVTVTASRLDLTDVETVPG